MYAVIKTGGKQYRVSPGDKLRVESLKIAEGETIDFDQILMVSNGEEVSIGNPLLSQTIVTGKVLSHGRGDKVRIVKFRRRKHHRKQMGHRQNYTELEIVSINGVTTPSTTDSSSQKTDSSNNNIHLDDEAEAAASTPQVTATEASTTEAPKFLDAPDGDPDDLKKILGIGSVLEEKLNDIGVYHYNQIANFTDTDIENVNAHLNFPGRIERDEWIPQAKDIMAGGEGRKLKYLDGPDGEPDDLKLILGVGPVLEEKLNELGIYHFRQIAAFEQKDIDLVNDATAFPGRIERDEWIDQAKVLADGGEPR